MAPTLLATAAYGVGTMPLVRPQKELRTMLCPCWIVTPKAAAAFGMPPYVWAKEVTFCPKQDGSTG